MASSEFDLIARYFTRPSIAHGPGTALGIGDDCALVKPAPGHELAISTDTLVSGVHFFADVRASKLGHKALAVNLSDLAAMGATPRWFTLALTLPEIDPQWLEGFSRGLFALADEAEIQLIGGDTTRGPLAITITVLGELPAGKALRRDRARDGDDVWVSGTLGDAALGLRSLQGTVTLTPAHRAAAVGRLELPTARIELGKRLLSVAHAAIDISDGLVADLGHICARSGLGAAVRLDALPLSEGLIAVRNPVLRADCVLAGGDDYELCFTAPRSAHAEIDSLGAQLGLRLSCIGGMHAGKGVKVLDAHGAAVAVQSAGFDHFSKHD